MSIEMIHTLESLKNIPLSEGINLYQTSDKNSQTETASFELLREDIFQKNISLKNFLNDLDHSEANAIFQNWKFRILKSLSELEAPSTRLEWLMHTITNEHELLGLIDIIFEFNTKQIDEKLKSFDLIDMSYSSMGLFLKIKKIDFDKIL